MGQDLEDVVAAGAEHDKDCVADGALQRAERRCVFRVMMGSDFAGSWAGLVGKTSIDAPSGMKEGQIADGTIEHAPDTGCFAVEVWVGT